MIHFIFGPTGAGKTTYAIELAKRLNAVRLSIDEWMGTLFFADIKGELTFSWAMERVNRCEAQIWNVSRQLLSQETSVVLEISMSTRQLRNKQKTLAENSGASYKLHYLNADLETRRTRVRDRNKQKGTTFSFEVNDSMFEFVENMFEVPAPDELEGADVVRTSGH